MFEAHPHLVTGEPAFRYVDWAPADLAVRGTIDTIGRPLRSFVVCVDRVEVTPSWCYSSGHAEWYEDGEPEVVRRDDPAGQAELARRFGDNLASEITRVFSVLDG